MKICRMKLVLKDPDDDMAAWQFVFDVLTRLGLAGMSSDESDEDSKGRPLFHVKVLAWRKDIDKFLDFVDAHRNDPGVFDPRGSKYCFERKRDKEYHSNREPVHCLPRSFYDEAWLTKPGKQEMILMDVSKEHFRWKDLRAV